MNVCETQNKSGQKIRTLNHVGNSGKEPLLVSILGISAVNLDYVLILLFQKVRQNHISSKSFIVNVEEFPPLIKCVWLDRPAKFCIRRDVRHVLPVQTIMVFSKIILIEKEVIFDNDFEV